MPARFTILVLTLTLAVSACRPDRDGAAATDDAGRAADAAPAAASVDLRDLTAFKLSMDRIDRYYAARRNLLRVLAPLSPEQRAAMEIDGNGDGTLDDMVRTIETNPALNDAIRAAGSTAREYTMTLLALVQSSMAVAVADMTPGANQDSLARAIRVNPANVAFVRQHEAELRERLEALRREADALGIGDDE